MNTKRVVLILLIVVVIIASVSVVSAGLFDGLFKGEQKDNVIELDNITFNTTNVTKFKIHNETEGPDGYYKWYIQYSERKNKRHNRNLWHKSI